MASTDSLDPSNWLGYELISGTSGAAAPFANNSGSFGPIGPPGQSPALVNLPGANLGSGAPGTPLAGANLSFGQTPQQQQTAAVPAAGSSTAPGLPSGSLADYFARAVIVVLGFIFVAVGLHMLMPGTVPNVAKVVRP